VLEFIEAKRFRFAWQGRYTLPLAVGLPIICGFALAPASPPDPSTRTRGSRARRRPREHVRGSSLRRVRREFEALHRRLRRNAPFLASSGVVTTSVAVAPAHRVRGTDRRACAVALAGRRQQSARRAGGCRGRGHLLSWVRVGVHALRVNKHREAALVGHDGVVLIPILVGPAGGAEHVAQQLRNAAASRPVSSSSGPARSAAPSTATHSQPARKTTVARGRRRRYSCLRVSPRTTTPTTASPLTGWGRTPALATEAWGEPSDRWVTTTARP
jgi:hypothetical protein